MSNRGFQAVEQYTRRQYDIDDLQTGRMKKLRSAIGGIGCGLAGAALGMGLAVNGAEYEAEIAGIPAEITTNISTERHLKIKGEVVDPESPSTDLGWIEFSDVTQLPLSIDVQLYADAELVKSFMGSDVSGRISLLSADARVEGQRAAKFFEKRMLYGGLAGSVTAELALITSSRLKRKHQTEGLATEFIKRSARTTGSFLTMASLVGGSIAATTINRDWDNSYEMHGESSALTEFSGRNDFYRYDDSALGKIINDIEQSNACPDSSELSRDNPSDIVVTTYNIKRGDTMGIEAIADQLQATNSDVIALQEVTETTLEQLAKELDMYPIHGWTIESGGFKYGNAILTNLTMKHAYSYQLPSDNVESRQLLVTVLELPSGDEAVFAATHLTNMSSGLTGDANKSIREDQANEVAKILDYQYYAKRPVVLMGDMNSTPESSIYDILNQNFADAVIESGQDHIVTTPTTGETFDYIYSKPGQAIDATSLLPAGATFGGDKASDHCSVSSVFET